MSDETKLNELNDESNETIIDSLIDKVEEDAVPLNTKFDINETDPLVLLGKMNEIVSKLKDIKSLVEQTEINSSTALDEVYAMLDEVNNALTSVNDLATKSEDNYNKAIASLENAIDSLNNAIDTLNNAIEEQQTTIAKNEDFKADVTSEINDYKGEVNGKIDDFNATLTDYSNTINNFTQSVDTTIDAFNTQINNFQTTIDEYTQKVNDLESKVHQSLGTTLTDTNGNALTTASITGENGINVDMSEDNPNEFDIRLDNTITESIEALNTQVSTNTNNIGAIQTELGEHEQSNTEEFSNLSALIQNIQNDLTASDTRITQNEDDIVNLTTMLAETEELATKTSENSKTYDVTKDETHPYGIYYNSSENSYTKNRSDSSYTFSCYENSITFDTGNSFLSSHGLSLNNHSVYTLNYNDGVVIRGKIYGSNDNGYVQMFNTYQPYSLIVTASGTGLFTFLKPLTNYTMIFIQAKNSTTGDVQGSACIPVTVIVNDYIVNGQNVTISGPNYYSKIIFKATNKIQVTAYDTAKVVELWGLW